ncbi:L,D-transpeptidase family protein [Streptomyces sp. NPDC001185]|uniref:L,D-transpeptidase family protein n=1 Tax=Streptomyces sp. NPDC001185 TaxID=3154380 RepID=UPI00332E6452
MTTEQHRPVPADERPAARLDGSPGGSLGPRRAMAATVVLSALLSGCAGAGTGTGTGTGHGERMSVREDGAHTGRRAGAGMPSTSATTRPSAHPAPAPGKLPGVGPRTLARIPDRTRQVVLVTGENANSPESTVVLYRRTGAGWRPGAVWRAHNAFRGWTHDHRAGDLRSPVGVFTLTAAGGRLADPGGGLPYDRSGGFTAHGTGFEGEPLAGSFDYVVAIDYNHRPGTSPLDRGRPLGASRGGGIWLHVDHGGPTHGCIGLGTDHMKELLRVLEPARHPVIVMGDAASLGT